MSEKDTAGETPVTIGKGDLHRRWLLSVAPMMDWADKQ